MPNVQNQLNIVNVAPPTILPTIQVTVKVGQTVNITRAIVNAAQTYYQPQNIELGRINIVSHEVNYNLLLSQTNNTQTLAYFTNNGSRIYRSSNVSLVTNGIIQRATINANTFRVIGVKIGQATVIYRATAHNGTTESAETTSVLGRIVIKVVTAVNNKPSQLKAGVQDVIIGSITTIEGTTVTFQYVDPENDPCENVRVAGLPTKGTLLYMGAPVTINQIIPYQHVLSGMLVYWNDEGVSAPGQTDTFSHTVSDTGSQQYY